MTRAVVDADVLLAALRSRNGASHVVLRRMLTGELPFLISPAIMLEYEEVTKRRDSLGPTPWIGAEEIDTILDALCARGVPVTPFLRFRPFLDDPKDDLYIECALAGGADTIITFDRHFAHPAVAAFGLAVMSPGKHLSSLRAEGTTT